MWNRYFEPADIEERRSLRAVDVAQLLLAGSLFIGAFLLYENYDACNEKGRTWYQVMLYGNLFWIFFLFTTLVGKYKNKMIRFFFRILDFFFYAYYLGMWIWNLILWVHKNEYLGSFYPSCNDAANYYADCYRYLGYFFLGVLAIAILATLLSFARPKTDLRNVMDPATVLHDPMGMSGAPRPYGPTLVTADKRPMY